MLEPKNVKAVLMGGEVISAPETLEKYAQDISFVNHVKPEMVVKPVKREEIEKLVQLANQTLTPLVPVSSGFPHFRGDTVPSTGEAIIVDLSGMKKVVRVDRKNRVVMFEPGVTFGELIAATARAGLRLNVPLMPRSTKSVVGSLLEREPVILPKYHWDIADPLCDVEIVLGNGNLFRTGAAAGPGTLEEQWEVGGAQKEAAGPSSASWYRVIQGSQGNMGIVTWASARCEISPQLEDPFIVGSNDLTKILEMVHWLVRLRLVNECLVLNNTDLASMLAKKWPAEYQAIRSSLPAWILFYNVAGYDYFPQERVQGQVQDIYDLCQKVDLEPQKTIGKASAYEMLKMVRSPSPEPYWKLRAKGASQDIFFITSFDKVNQLVDTMYGLVKESKYSNIDMGVYIQPVVQGVNYHCEFTLFYNPDDPKATRTIKLLSRRAIKQLMAGGAFFSRPYGENCDLIMNKDAMTLSSLKKVKGILDPKHIMNPGKLGL